MSSKNIDEIISLSKRRGFVYPGSEIYGGFANSYTYGPYGVELKNNIKQLWWKTFVQSRPDMIGMDGDILLHPQTWHASGHVAGFSDQMVDCKNCQTRSRADHLVEAALKKDCEGLPDEEVTALIRENNISCPSCGSNDLTDVRKFNLMFTTQMAKTGKKDSEDEDVFLRPETAQAIFLEFKNIIDSMRIKLPFGIGQIGKAFRNEITPGNFIFRRLEFEMMEIEYFIRESDWKELFVQWQEAMKEWCTMIGLDPQKCHDYEHPSEKLSHYSKRTVDIEYDFPFGRKELYGLAYRTDFDLSQHEKYSGKKLQYHDTETNERFIPHVLEPTFGVDRTILAVLCESYCEESVNEGKETRIVLKIPSCIAPVKVAILPLMKKEGMNEKAKEIFEEIRTKWNCEYDEGGTIGKRYRRQDEIGTPFCITIDFDSIGKGEDPAIQNTVTIRNRDTMEQSRIETKDIISFLEQSL